MSPGSSYPSALISALSPHLANICFFADIKLSAKKDLVILNHLMGWIDGCGEGASNVVCYGDSPVNKSFKSA